MCFLFQNKKIVSVEILNQTDGIDEDEQLLNYAVGHMISGFDGMVHASVLNDELSDTTTFKIEYSNGSTEIKVVNNNSLAYSKYIKFLKG